MGTGGGTTSVVPLLNVCCYGFGYMWNAHVTGNPRFMPFSFAITCSVVVLLSHEFFMSSTISSIDLFALSFGNASRALPEILVIKNNLRVGCCSFFITVGKNLTPSMKAESFSLSPSKGIKIDAASFASNIALQVYLDYTSLQNNIKSVNFSG